MPPKGSDGALAMAEYTHPPGQAPVKREYIRTFAASAPAAAPVDDDAAEAGGTKEPAQAASAEQPRKRQRGMNKHRTHHRPVQAVRMCNAFVKTSQCQFDGRDGRAACKFSHDLAASFAAREPDLGDTCPLYTLNGFCRFGVTCRFGASHLRPDGANIFEAGAEQNDGSRHPDLNLVSSELTNTLRKNRYDFGTALGVWHRVAAAMEAIAPHHPNDVQVRGPERSAAAIRGEEVAAETLTLTLTPNPNP